MSTSTTSGNEELVHLNVGGKQFTTYKSTLMAYPDTMLARMFSTSAGIAKKGPSGEYFLDRNPDLFGIILEFYRNKALIVPKSTPLESLYNELQYFGIDYEEDDIQIAGEPKHVPVECFLSLTKAYSLLPKKGHLIGSVIMGLPQFDYEEDAYGDMEEEEADEKKEEETEKLYNAILFGKAPKKFGSISRADSDEEDEVDEEAEDEESSPPSPPKKKTKADSKDKNNNNAKKHENGSYPAGLTIPLKKIQGLLSGVVEDSFFCCGGEGKTDKNVALKMKQSSKSGQQTTLKNPQHIADFYHGPPVTSFPNVDCGTANALKMDLIKSLCTPAPFGDLKAMKTKIDPNVRLALECSEDRFNFEFGSQLWEITQYVMKVFNFKKNIDAKPYKVNIYEPGGFFKEHVDTPIDPDTMIGSLVVCLPSKHEGGELVVSNNGITHTFDFAAKSGDKDIYQWAAFYSDCIHEVKPVTTGTRITVTYVLNKTDGKAYFDTSIKAHKTFFHGPTYDSVNVAQLDSILDGLNALPKEIVKIGLFLSHKYTTSALDKETLKGSDGPLIEKLSTKWDCYLTPVVYNEYQMEGVGEYAFEHREHDVKTDLKYLNGQGPKPHHPFSSVPFVISDQKGHLLVNKSDEDTGNDSRPAEKDSIYYHAAVVLTRK